MTDLQAHVVREEGEEVVLHMAVDERVAEGPVQQRVPREVQDAVRHLVNAFRPRRRGEHGQADVLWRQHLEY